MFDHKKILSNPADPFEAVDALITKEQELLQALFIMDGIIRCPGEEYAEIHRKKITEFLAKYKTETPEKSDK